MNTKQFIFGGIELEAIQLANEDWIFHGQIVCEECELTGTTYSRYLKDAVPKKWLTEFKIEGKVGRPALYLLEPGLYYVVSQAKTENGVKFRDWVFEEVLTAIRTDGGYISSEASKEQLTTLQDKIQAQMLAIEEIDRFV
jgi:prophage antirepressor-like protein